MDVEGDIYTSNQTSDRSPLTETDPATQVNSTVVLLADLQTDVSFVMKHKAATT